MDNKGGREAEAALSMSNLWHMEILDRKFPETRGLLLDLHQFSNIRMHFLRSWIGADGLRSAPVIDVGNLVHARYGAVRRTALFRDELAPDVVDGVLLERLSRISALLGAIVY